MNEPKSKEVPPGSESSNTGATVQASTVDYDVVALPMTIYYNREGDHDHNGMLYALEANAPILKYIEALAGRVAGGDLAYRLLTRRRCTRRRHKELKTSRSICRSP
ncbi:MAG TPA: hypothetical protein VFY56_05230, partial [Propionibacteriaceae bacterium]|nr:hypothetical protein [Propionibacteriaceae bacterium]